MDKEILKMLQIWNILNLNVKSSAQHLESMWIKNSL